MIKFPLFAVCILFVTGLYAQGPFPPAAGQPGTTAIAINSNAVRAWATGVEVVRGYIQLSDTSVYNMGSNKAVFGRYFNATGPAGTDPAAIVSLGDGGMATLTFDCLIVNGPGPDFAVFENSFGDTFLELAFVEVSSDGINFSRFPSHSLTPADIQKGAWDELYPSMIHNLAGKYRQGFGTPFDLSDLEPNPLVDVFAIRFVRIADVVGSIDPLYANYDSEGRIINDPFPTPFNSGGFDLDGVAVINCNVPHAVADFEGLIPESDAYFLPQSAGRFVSGSLSFNYDAGFGSWSGFSFANRVTLSGDYTSDQFVSVTRAGIDADSSAYGIAYVAADWMGGTFDPVPSVIETPAGNEAIFSGFYVTNTEMAYSTMRDGTLYNKKFGGDSGNDPDWFRLKVWGVRADNSQTEVVEHYLADFRNDDNSLDYIQDDWRWVDLMPLGAVKSLSFILESSDSGDFGINTPAYFCMDNLTMLNTQGPVIAAWLPDREVAMNADPVSVVLGDFFYFSGDDLIYEVAANTNPELIHAVIEDNKLSLGFSAGETGSGEISVMAVAGGLSVTDRFQVTVRSNVGINDVESITFKAYPNPVSDQLVIVSRFHGDLQVIGMDGTVVRQMKVSAGKSAVSFHGLPAGIYLLKFVDNRGTSVSKVVKK